MPSMPWKTNTVAPPASPRTLALRTLVVELTTELLPQGIRQNPIVSPLLSQLLSPNNMGAEAMEGVRATVCDIADRLRAVDLEYPLGDAEPATSALAFGSGTVSV